MVKKQLIYSGEKLGAVIEAAGQTMYSVAKGVGLTPAAIWKLRHERVKDPSFETLTKIAAFCGVPVQALLKDDIPPRAADKFTALISALTPANQAALMGAAEALLASQKRHK